MHTHTQAGARSRRTAASELEQGRIATHQGRSQIATRRDVITAHNKAVSQTHGAVPSELEEGGMLILVDRRLHHLHHRQSLRAHAPIRTHTACRRKCLQYKQTCEQRDTQSSEHTDTQTCRLERAHTHAHMRARTHARTHTYTRAHTLTALSTHTALHLDHIHTDR